MSDTPETDAFFAEWTRTDGVLARSRLHAENLERERDEAKEQIEELIYIAGRAIDLADIDFENDKFGVVSELRDDLEKIKKWQGRARAPFSGVGFQE
jgi:hypothetical protein